MLRDVDTVAFLIDFGIEFFAHFLRHLQVYGGQGIFSLKGIQVAQVSVGERKTLFVADFITDLRTFLILQFCLRIFFLHLERFSQVQIIFAEFVLDFHTSFLRLKIFYGFTDIFHRIRIVFQIDKQKPDIRLCNVRISGITLCFEIFKGFQIHFHRFGVLKAALVNGSKIIIKFGDPCSILLLFPDLIGFQIMLFGFLKIIIPEMNRSQIAVNLGK